MCGSTAHPGACRPHLTAWHRPPLLLRQPSTLNTHTQSQHKQDTCIVFDTRMLPNKKNHLCWHALYLSACQPLQEVSSSTHVVRHSTHCAPHICQPDRPSIKALEHDTIHSCMCRRRQQASTTETAHSMCLSQSVSQ